MDPVQAQFDILANGHGYAEYIHVFDATFSIVGAGSVEIMSAVNTLKDRYTIFMIDLFGSGISSSDIDFRLYFTTPIGAMTPVICETLGMDDGVSGFRWCVSAKRFTGSEDIHSVKDLVGLWIPKGYSLRLEWSAGGAGTAGYYFGFIQTPWGGQPPRMY